MSKNDLAKKAKITKEDSIKIALEKVPGTAGDVELENEDGTVVYAVEVKAKDGSKQDVKIDAQSGKVIKIDNERDEQDNKKE
ncbi:PepSY domain-containing protein [Bacillus methanolicus]|uniref:PepSY domain-containing protein n=1 Tax=Bacillus methanolicus TaxID=1471 RepID=UPI00200BD6A0|nr:PepSY domain-containing protein [Bacillus methanolicus]